jgi:subtilisin family serine protease
MRLTSGTRPLAAASAIMFGCLLVVPALPAAAGTTAAGTTRTAAGPPDLAGQWWLGALGVPQAWQGFTGRRSPASLPGAGVTVAVLSTGVDASHPDLAGDVTTGPDLTHSGARPGDPYWGVEGTAVASLIAGHGHGARDGLGTGSQGITGIAPGARILSLRVTLEYDDPRNADARITRGLPDAIAAGIRYAISHGASVIALPLDPGTLGSLIKGDPAASGGSRAERAAVAAALAANVVLVAPAGDNAASTGTMNYPAAYKGVIAVGATGQGGSLESFSSTRSYVALTAPGAGLTPAAPGGGYDAIKTTDMSAALTAGVAALIRARYPRLSAAQVTRAIEHGTTPEAAGSHAAGTGAGVLNAPRALRQAAAIAAALPPSASPTQAPTPPQSPASARSASQAASAPSSLGSEARSALRDVAFGAGILILLLVALLVVAKSSRRRARALRLEQVPAGLERPALTARQAPLGRLAITSGFQALASHGTHAAGRDRTTSGAPAVSSQLAIGGQRAQGTPVPGTASPGGPVLGSAAARPRLRTSLLARSGSLGQMGRPPIRPDQPYDSVPWEPARLPADASAGFPHDHWSMPRPPWERAADPLAATPVSPDDPAWRAPHTGPMYVWDPATNSGPLPLVPRDD